MKSNKFILILHNLIDNDLLVMQEFFSCVGGDFMRIRKNYFNLGLWACKDSQGKITINIGKYRIQF